MSLFLQQFSRFVFSFLNQCSTLSVCSRLEEYVKHHQESPVNFAPMLLACVAAVLKENEQVEIEQRSNWPTIRVQYGGQFDRCLISTCSSPQKTAATQATMFFVRSVSFCSRVVVFHLE